MAMTLPTEYREAILDAVDQGATIDGSGRHPKLVFPEHLIQKGRKPFVSIPTTPGDSQRGHLNFISELRRAGFRIGGRTYGAQPKTSIAVALQAAVKAQDRETEVTPRKRPTIITPAREARLSKARSIRGTDQTNEHLLESAAASWTLPWTAAEAADRLGKQHIRVFIPKLVKKRLVVPVGRRIENRVGKPATTYLHVRCLGEVPANVVEPVAETPAPRAPGVPSDFWKSISEALVHLASAVETLGRQ